MLLNCILLALSVSIDSLGIGITYGIKHTKIRSISNIILFAISFCMTSGSIFIGHYISILFSPIFSALLGSALLILLGIYNIFKLLQIEYVRRLTYLDNPGATKHGIRIMLNMGF